MRDSDIDSLSADGAQEPYPADSAEWIGGLCPDCGRPVCVHFAQSYRFLTDKAELPVARPADSAEALLREAVTLVEHAGARGSKWEAWLPKARAALQASAPSPAAEPIASGYANLTERAVAEGPCSCYCHEAEQ